MSASHEPRRDRATSARVRPRSPGPWSVEGPAGAVAAVYRVRERDWWLWWRCDICGGAALPLRDGGSLSRMREEGIVATPDAQCPRCETHRRRLAPAGPVPAVWYDTLVRDWVVRLPSPDAQLPSRGELPRPEASPTPTLPLGLRWFDSPWPEIYRAAADLAYAGDLFEDELA